MCLNISLIQFQLEAKIVLLEFLWAGISVGQSGVRFCLFLFYWGFLLVFVLFAWVDWFVTVNVLTLLLHSKVLLPSSNTDRNVSVRSLTLDVIVLKRGKHI